ncbi:MAG TPA: TraB/GumN family protein [Albitalea sp.]|nr:TraB/GumN family protein [Albitalea sp.]
MRTALTRWLRALCCGALLAASWPSSAQSAADCPPVASALPTAAQLHGGLQSARDRGFLWRIDKDGRSSYLYGTVHVGKLEWTIPGTALMQAVRSSNTIALELDLGDPALVVRLQALMAPKPGHALPPELTERLRAQLKLACLPEPLLAELAPEVLATTLVVMAGRVDGLDPAYAIDAMLAGMGHSLHKSVVSLETPELQFAVLLGRTPQETQAIVTQALDELESGKARPLLTRIARLWASSNLAELDSYAQWCDCMNSDEERAMERRLLDERNPALAERIDALHAAGQRVFAAVGSLHMIGPLGLPALMAQRGYRVERVVFGPSTHAQ